MVPQKEIKAWMQLDSLLFTFSQLSEETDSRKLLQTLGYFHSFPEKGKSSKTDRQGGGKKKKLEGAGLQDPTPVPTVLAQAGKK